ncbi:radical SAM/SPASM domain-containing protein [Candidatus Methanoperedens nitratireducens]|uniref:Putative Radical SAM domain protein n=1 Tax=Candidatus Methanoperedens nitratireducens TaxID=1392998 RepID=A0A284VT36_9EURY|nr:radical SAM protein [Candidatus Methanoperedens nitroreducens]SNQ62451.1 putative Radical SAM domain protein [Candidatus Methanoperedens nitroreducens]
MGLVSLQNVELNSEMRAKQESEAASTTNNLKTSSYNYFIRYNDTNFFGYNFLYRSILRIPADAFPFVDQFLRGLSSKSEGLGEVNSNPLRLPPQWLEALKEVHFVIDKSIDELSLIKFHYFRSLYANNSLSLIVLPTLWCNLACPYCFEFKKPIFMKSEVEDALINWIEKSFKNKRYVHIAWFGGEPLLAKKVIFRLTKRLQEFCNSIGANYGASLTTNGYFLDQKFIEAIPSLSIKQVQVTMDGDKADHDALKRKRNGEGSFDRVFQNIVTLCESVSDCNLLLRINCGDDNYNGIERLLERFPPIVKARASVFFRWIWANKASGYREFSARRQGTGTESFQGLTKLEVAAKALGWHIYNSYNYNVGYCEVDFLDHYAIGPDGNVFLCTHTYENSESIGYLLEGRNVTRSNTIGKITRWYTVNPFNDAECVICQLLPICCGGCRKARMEGGRSCIEEKKSLDLFVRSLVEERLIPAAMA